MKLDYDPAGDQFHIELEDDQHHGPEWQSLQTVLDRSTMRTPANFLVAYQLASQVPVDKRSRAAREKIAELVSWRDRCKAAHGGLHIAEKNYFGFQSKNGRLIEEAGSAMICDKTGLGKTRSVLNGLQSVPPPFLIVCPKKAMRVWQREIHAIDPKFKVLQLRGLDKKQRTAALHPNTINIHDFVIINYDVIKDHSAYRAWAPTFKDEKTGEPKWPGNPEMGELNFIDWQAVVFDEAHRIKDPTTIRTRAAMMLSNNARRRIAITATPVGNVLEDLWSQMHCVWPHELPSLTRFRERFFLTTPGHFGGVEIDDWSPRGRREFEECFGWRMSRRDYHDADVKLDLQDFPEELPEQHIDVPLSKREREAYEALVDSWIQIDDEGNARILGSPLAAMQECRRQACGMPVLNSDGEVIGLDMPSAKVKLLNEVIEDAACPTVVFTDHTAPLHLAVRYLTQKGHSVSYIDGSVPEPQRDAAIDNFQHGLIDVLVATIKTAGEAITLTNAGLLVYLEDTWSLLDKTQSRGRVRRIGSETSVPTLVLRAEDTVDMAVTAALVEKAGYLDGFRQDAASLADVLRGREL